MFKTETFNEISLVILFRLQIIYRPFYSCLLSDLAFGTDLTVCCVNQVVLMVTRCIFMRKTERSAWKQGQLQPRCHSNARSPRGELKNGLLTKKNIFCSRWLVCKYGIVHRCLKIEALFIALLYVTQRRPQKWLVWFDIVRNLRTTKCLCSLSFCSCGYNSNAWFGVFKRFQ